MWDDFFRRCFGLNPESSNILIHQCTNILFQGHGLWLLWDYTPKCLVPNLIFHAPYLDSSYVMKNSVFVEFFIKNFKDRDRVCFTNWHNSIISGNELWILLDHKIFFSKIRLSKAWKSHFSALVKIVNFANFEEFLFVGCSKLLRSCPTSKAPVGTILKKVNFNAFQMRTRKSHLHAQNFSDNV